MASRKSRAEQIGAELSGARAVKFPFLPIQCAICKSFVSMPKISHTDSKQKLLKQARWVTLNETQIEFFETFLNV